MNARPAARCLAVLALAAAVAAQDEPLFAPPIHPSVVNIRGTAPGDLNEDGLPDLLVWANAPSVMLGLDGGGFAPPVAVAPGQTVSCQLADFNEDGHLDLVGVNAFLDALRVALGGGDGTFGPLLDIATAADLRTAVVADFDGDGHLDLAAAGLHTGRVSVHLGHGDGTFDPKQDYGPVGDYATKITAADLTGDGVLDMAVASGNDAQVSLLHGDGDGTFTTAPPLLMPGGVEDVGAIDLDDDGDLDLVIAMVSTGLRVVFNAGGGTFPGPASTYPLPSNVNSLLVVADFDEDGRDDVALGIGADDLVVVYRSTGLPGAGTLELMGPYVGGRNPQHVACADMDLDGDLDLIASNFGGNNLRILRGEGDGSFRTAAGGWGVGCLARGVATGDFDEDGRVDIVSCGEGTALSVTLNAGDGRFPKATAWPLPDGIRRDAVVADFNGDGQLDVATADAEFFTSGATIALGDGDGQLLAVKKVVIDEFGQWSFIDAADFDLDGDLDVVLGHGGTSEVQGIQVAFNDGDGDLSAGPALATDWFGPRGVCARDFDADGAPDIAVIGNSRVSVFRGDGAGGFDRPLASNLPAGDYDLAAADFDGDGIQDLAVSAYNGQFVVLGGLGDGTFEVSQEFFPLPNPVGLAIGDIDDDGNLDIVSANNHQFGTIGSVSVLTGNGDGSFDAPAQFTTGRSPWQVAIGDFDGDGWNDLVAAPFSGIDVLLNRRGPWNEVGHGLAGVQGIPRQTGIGTLVPGQPFAFQLRDARPLTTAYHVVGLAPLMAPFKGGVMVPSIDFINGLAATNAQGNLTLAGPWINAPSGLTLWFQFWQKDPAGPLGFAASTAVSATMP